MDLHGKKSLWRSFGYAFEGLCDVIANERNMRIHIGIALVTIIGAMWLHFSLFKWAILLLVIAGIFVIEIINSAIERTVDLVTEEFHPLAKRAKDAAAAAVFIYSLFAVVIGLILFLPPLLQRLL